MTKGKLLVITNWRDRSHPEAGGAEVVCEQLGRYFARRGWRVVLFSAKVAGCAPREQLAERLEVVRQGGRLGVYLRALWWLARNRRQVGAVIDSQNGIPFFTPLALRRSTPVLLLVHHVHQDQFAMYLPRGLAALGKWLERTGTRLAYGRRAVLVVSASTRQDVRQRLELRGEITVAAPGLDLPTGEASQRSQSPTIVCVSRLVAHKQLQLAVQMVPGLLSEIPQLKLHIVGDGPSWAELQQEIERLGVGNAVVMHGELSAAQRDRLVSSAWLAVNVSAREGWGLTVLEANALGVPVLALRNHGLRDSVRDGQTGWLVDSPQDLGPAALSALRQLSDPDIAAEWAARARSWATQFSWDHMGQRVFRAMVAEEGRLAHRRDERRLASDVATVAFLPATALPDTQLVRLRAADYLRRDQNGTVMLLQGVDTGLARKVLIRAGLPPSLADATRCSVARPGDLVVPQPAPSRIGSEGR